MKTVNLETHKYLISTIFAIMIWIICIYLEENYYPYIYNFDQKYARGYMILTTISTVSILFGIRFLIIFIKLLIKPEINDKEINYLLALIFLIAGYYFLLLFLDNQIEVDIQIIVFRIIDALNLIYLISSIYIINNDLIILLADIKRLNKAILIKQINYLIKGLNLSMIGIIPILIISSFFDRKSISYAFILLTVSMSIISYSILLEPKLLFALPENIYLSIVASKQGILKYSKQFNEFASISSTYLITNVLSALTGLMTEFYHSEVYPNMIKFQDRLILIQWEEDYYIAVFCDWDSKLIRTSMNNIAKEINMRYGDNTSSVMELSHALNLDDIYNSLFYYLEEAPVIK
ncbi:MAG: hypothetical protein OEZ01_08670 [Candidatus Heimdallarchaeota archaeon]|nr:hypothetical protein [Candidatus Heimdallarchaeota archaeon]MDH5646067.1 hypothetical protein [Candidatus Heimdallarchaeota archaeon]